MNSLKWLEAWDLAGAVEAITAVAPPPDLRARLMSRVAQAAAGAPVVEIRAGQGRWRPSGMPGVQMQMLYHEAETGRSTLLFQLEAGAFLPAHKHGAAEQCLVLAGDFFWEGYEYGPGDFVVLGVDTVHPRVGTRQGATVLIVAGHNEAVGDEDEKG